MEEDRFEEEEYGEDRQGPPPRRFGWQKALFLLLLLLVIAWVVLKLPDFSKRAELGIGYAAHAGCACHYIEGRPLDSCTADLEGAAWMVSMDREEDRRAVTASVPLFGSRTSEYRKGWGCLLEPQ